MPRAPPDSGPVGLPVMNTASAGGGTLDLVVILDMLELTSDPDPGG